MCARSREKTTGLNLVEFKVTASENDLRFDLQYRRTRIKNARQPKQSQMLWRLYQNRASRSRTADTAAES